MARGAGGGESARRLTTLTVPQVSPGAPTLRSTAHRPYAHTTARCTLLGFSATCYYYCLSKLNRGLERYT